jgi:hypothetical protein
MDLATLMRTVKTVGRSQDKEDSSVFLLTFTHFITLRQTIHGSGNTDENSEDCRKVPSGQLCFFFCLSHTLFYYIWAYKARIWQH